MGEYLYKKLKKIDRCAEKARTEKIRRELKKEKIEGNLTQMLSGLGLSDAMHYAGNVISAAHKLAEEGFYTKSEAAASGPFNKKGLTYKLVK